MGIDLSLLIGKTTNYEKKLQLEINKPKSWYKSVSAFANRRGGFLIFNLADESPIHHLRLFCTRRNGLNQASIRINAPNDEGNFLKQQ